MLDAGTIVELLTSGLGPAGIDVVQPLQLAWYNEAVPSELGARIKPSAAGREDCLVVLIGNSKLVWEPFLKACSKDPGGLLASEHPFNQFVEDAVESSLQALLPERPRIYWSHKRTGDLDGDCQYVAMQRMAEAAGLAFLDHDSHLSLHPKFGPWFSLRCALVFDDMGYGGRRPAPMRNPMSPTTQHYVRMAIETAILCAERRCAKAELARISAGSGHSSGSTDGAAPTAAELLAAADRAAEAMAAGGREGGSGAGGCCSGGSGGSPRAVAEECSACNSRRCSGDSSCGSSSGGERSEAGEYGFAVHCPASEVVEVPACSMDAVRSTWKRWVAVRDAPCPGHPWRYSEDQLTYHYTADREVLLQALLRRKLLRAVPEGTMRSQHAAVKLVLQA